MDYDYPRSMLKSVQAPKLVNGIHSTSSVMLPTSASGRNQQVASLSPFPFATLNPKPYQANHNYATINPKNVRNSSTNCVFTYVSNLL